MITHTPTQDSSATFVYVLKMTIDCSVIFPRAKTPLLTT
jgi:hypothetical protein